jgi:stearoyl-CoA desaturase (delta-9 desaturase)
MQTYLESVRKNVILVLKLGLTQVPVYLMTVLGIIFFWDSSYLIYTLIGYLLFGLSLEITHHRYYSHGSFTCSRPVEYFMLTCAVFAGCGGPLYYAGLHRTHHKYSDTDKDTHQPTDHPFLSFLHCDATRNNIDWKSVVNDLVVRSDLMFLHKNYNYIYFGIIALMALISIKFTLFFFILPAILIIWVTGLVNVINHKYGYRTFDTPDKSTNNLWLNLITFGGALHHNHHYKPYSHTTKVKWFELDLCGWIIKHLLAKTVKE